MTALRILYRRALLVVNDRLVSRYFTQDHKYTATLMRLTTEYVAFALTLADEQRGCEHFSDFQNALSHFRSVEHLLHRLLDFAVPTDALQDPPSTTFLNNPHGRRPCGGVRYCRCVNDRGCCQPSYGEDEGGSGGEEGYGYEQRREEEDGWANADHAYAKDIISNEALYKWYNNNCDNHLPMGAPWYRADCVLGYSLCRLYNITTARNTAIAYSELMRKGALPDKDQYPHSVGTVCANRSLSLFLAECGSLLSSRCVATRREYEEKDWREVASRKAYIARGQRVEDHYGIAFPQLAVSIPPVGHRTDNCCGCERKDEEDDHRMMEYHRFCNGRILCGIHFSFVDTGGEGELRELTKTGDNDWFLWTLVSRALVQLSEEDANFDENVAVQEGRVLNAQWQNIIRKAEAAEEASAEIGEGGGVAPPARYQYQAVADAEAKRTLDNHLRSLRTLTRLAPAGWRVICKTRIIFLPSPEHQHAVSVLYHLRGNKIPGSFNEYTVGVQRCASKQAKCEIGMYISNRTSEHPTEWMKGYHSVLKPLFFPPLKRMKCSGQDGEAAMELSEAPKTLAAAEIKGLQEEKTVEELVNKALATPGTKTPGGLVDVSTACKAIYRTWCKKKWTELCSKALVDNINGVHQDQEKEDDNRVSVKEVTNFLINCIQCPVCATTESRLKRLHCSHNMCEQCIEGIANTREQSIAEAENQINARLNRDYLDGQKKIICPLCRHATTAVTNTLPNDLIVNQLRVFCGLL